jgi:hypothetical protein
MEKAIDTLTCFMGDLPDELLVFIVLQLRIDRGYLADNKAEVQRRSENAAIVRSLHALTVSCRKLNAIATPLLYQCILQTQVQPYMQALLRTLISRPELAKFVQYIEFNTFLPTKRPGPDIYTKSDLRKFKGSISTAQWLVPLPEAIVFDHLRRPVTRVPGSPSDQELESIALFGAIQRALQFEDTFSTFVTLLSMVDNLKDVALPYIDNEENILAVLALKRYTGTSVFHRLWLNSEIGGFSETYALRVLVGKLGDQYGSLANYLRGSLLTKPEAMYSGPPAVMKEVSLDVYDVQAKEIGTYLKSCRSVERFCCRWRWTDRFAPMWAVDLPSLRTGLLHVQSTLNHLTIDTMESAWRVDMDIMIPALGSLREFTALKHLDVTGLVLWGDDDTLESPPLSSILPEFLETLAIRTEWDDDVEDALYHLSLDCTGLLPHLKEVRCTWRPAPRLIGEHLVDAFQLLGVDLVLDIHDIEDP